MGEKPEKIYSYLGFAARARKIQSGGETCSITMSKGKGKLLIITEDASDNTKDKLMSQAKKYGVQARIYGESDNISHITGTSGRTAFIVTDEHFAECILAEIDGQEVIQVNQKQEVF